MFAEAGEGCYIEPPPHANWAGAGSVVTKDILAGCVAVGNPCRVIREISECDREFYYRERRIPAHFFETEE